MLDIDGLVGLLQRMVALGHRRRRPDLRDSCGSIDLSVANLISVAAVLASFIMQGRPEMMLPAVAAVLAISAVVGVINGAMIARLQVNPLIATLGVGLVLQGLLSASFTQFRRVRAAGVSGARLWRARPCAVFRDRPLRSRAARLGSSCARRNSARISMRSAATPRARGWPAFAPICVIIGAHVLCSVCAGLTGLYLASRLRSGAPWVGRDGVYDLESIAVVVIGGTLLAGGRGGVWGTLAGVLLFAVLDAVFNMLGVSAYPKLVLRGAIVIAAVAAYTFRIKELAA